MSDAVRFGQYLKILRNTKNLTLIQLGELTGYSNSYLSQVENGQKGIPSPEFLYKVKDALGVSHVHLMVKAGYIHLDPYGHEDDILLTDYEEAISKELENKRLAEIMEKNIERKELVNIIKNQDITINNRSLSDIDRQDILDIIEILFRNRN